jgi:hypothetical protein
MKYKESDMKLKQGWIWLLCSLFAVTGVADMGDDVYEPNDSRAEAYTGLASNQWLSTIAGAGIAADSDYYRIVVPDRQEKVTVECTFSHATGNIYIVLFDSSGAIIGIVDSASDNETLTDVLVPGPGTYFIQVYGTGENSYDLRWSTTYWDYDDDYEPNDTTGTAYVGLASNQWLSTISGDGVAGDFDFYEITVPDRQEKVSVECTFTNADGNIGLELYNSSSLIKHVDTATDNETLTDVQVPGPGTYYIRVYGTGRNPYDLRWSTAYWDYDDDYEPNNTTETAYVGLSTNQWLSSISGEGVAADFDYYEITVPDRQENVSVECTFTHADGNIRLELFNATGNPVGYADSADDDEMLTDIHVPGSGIYYIRVYGTSRNPYDLRWNTSYWDYEDDYEPNDTWQTAYSNLPPNQWLSSISGAGVAAGFDFYEITVPDGPDTISVECTFTHADGNIQLELYSGSGSYITGIDSADNNETLANISIPGQGTYYIRVYSSSNSRNAYDLLWTMGGPVELTVNNGRGTADPASGIYTNSAGSVIACSVSPTIAVDSGMQVECIGWTGTGAVPGSGTSNNIEVTLTEDSSITWLWQTNYWLDVTVSGSGSIDVVDGFYAADSEQILTATPDSGWLFMGWSGDASGTNNAVVTMDAPKAVTATFSDDADGDGLLNSNETAIGSNPWKSDTDDDGFDDKTEVDYGLSPTTDSSGLIAYIESNDETFGLYPSNVVLDVAMGEMLLDVVGAEAALSLQLQTSDDLQSWTNAGPAKVWNWTVGGDKKFFRVRSAK